MEEESRASELKVTDFLAVLKRCWWLMLIVCVIVGSTTALVLNLRHSPTYSSTATLYVVRESTTGKDTTSSDMSIATYLVKDFNVLITSNKVLDHVREITGLMLGNAELKRMVSVSNPDGTRILEIKVNAGDPTRAKVLADAFAETTNLYFNDLYQGGSTADGAQSQQVVKIWEDGTFSNKISNPISTLKIMLIAVLAAFAVYAVFFVIFIFDDKINDGEDVQTYLGLSMLGEIPNRYEALKRKEKYSYKYSYSSSPYTQSTPRSGDSNK